MIINIEEEKMKPRLYMIIPCYNEEKVLPITSEMFLEELNLLITKDKISENSRILFVNDGSKDKTWDLRNFQRKTNISSGFVRAETEDIKMLFWQE